MRTQSFVSYLEDYLRGVSGVDSLSIHKLAKLSTKQYRVLSPLMLYCVFSNKKDLFNRYTKNKYEHDVDTLNENNFLDEEYRDYDFHKIWNSYQNKINVFEYDADTKSMVRNRITALMKEKGITNYRVYTDLKLNPGNVNDFLTNGNVKKVSLDLTKKIFNYVYSR